MPTTTTKEAIENLWQEVRDLSLGTTTTVDHLPSPPTPLQFLRDYVSPNKPCLISNSTVHWPALSLWYSTSYLLKTLSSSCVSLHLTPTGRADSLAPHPNPNPKTPSASSSSLCFASAYVEKLPFSAALRMVTQSKTSGDLGMKCVAYLQEQNDCFRNEYSALSQDCEPHIGWASESLGCLPEAVNLWIGNDQSVTSFHKDHYENLYAVITGEKHFLLLPPTDVHRMYIRDYPAAQYRYSQDMGDFSLEVEDPVKHVPWCSVNPYPFPEEKERAMAEFPLYFNGPKPFEVTVKAGKFFTWYDMRFDIKYAYFNFLQSIDFKAPSDSAFHTRHVRSGSNRSNCTLKDESDINGSVENGDEHTDCSA